MQNNSRTGKIILIAGIVVLAFAMVLFLAAVSIGDFGQPGGSFLSGRSNALIAFAFALLAGLAAVLLTVIAGSRSGHAAAPEESTRTSDEESDAPAATVMRNAAPAAGQNGPSEILSDAAGQLKTAVEVIQDELEDMLEDEPADKEHIQVLHDETERITKIIEGMEQLSQAQALSMSLKKEPIELQPLLNGLIGKVRSAAGNSDITYELHCDAGLTAIGDARCLSIIIGNILENAAQVVKTGTVVINAEQQGTALILSVTDTGPGIRRKHLPHIYERFYRAAGTGVGLGLSIARELADACEGKIDVQTEAGKGTTFTVEFPLI